MAQTFNINAVLQLSGPSNLGPVVRAVQQQLSGINANISFKVTPGSNQSVANMSRNVAGLNSQLQATKAAASAGAASASQIGRGFSQSAAQVGKFGEQVGFATRRFLAFQIGAVIGLVKIQQALASAVGEALQFQKTMVGLSQLGATRQEIGEISGEITKLSKSLGVASKELADTTIVLKGAGLSTQEVTSALQALAKTSLTPTFKSIQNTTEGLVALRQQFGASANDFEKYLGTINTVARQFAAESEDLVVAIRKAGGAFKAASSDMTSSEDSFKQFISLFTSIRATTRESAEEISTGMRTIFARLQSTEVTNNLRDLGINLHYTGEEAALAGKNIKGQFVGAWEAIRRLQAATKDLPTTDPRFAAITAQIGGFRQISRVIPLLQQGKIQQQAYAAAQAGSNSLTEDAAKAQDLFLTKLTKVKNEFNDLIRTIGQNKALHVFADTLLTLSTSLIRLTKALEPALPLLATFAAIRLGQGLKANAPGFLRGVTSATNPVTRRQAGGIVPGHGSGDIVPAILPVGSYVVNKKSTKKHGLSQSSKHVPVLLEPGERVFTPEEVKKVGKHNLDLINKHSGGGLVKGGVRIGVPGLHPHIVRIIQAFHAKKGFDGGGEIPPTVAQLARLAFPHIAEDMGAKTRDPRRYANKFFRQHFKTDIKPNVNQGPEYEQIYAQLKDYLGNKGVDISSIAVNPKGKAGVKAKAARVEKIASNENPFASLISNISNSSTPEELATEVRRAKNAANTKGISDKVVKEFKAQVDIISEQKKHFFAGDVNTLLTTPEYTPSVQANSEMIPSFTDRSQREDYRSPLDTLIAKEEASRPNLPAEIDPSRLSPAKVGAFTEDNPAKRTSMGLGGRARKGGVAPPTNPSVITASNVLPVSIKEHGGRRSHHFAWDVQPSGGAPVPLDYPTVPPSPITGSQVFEALGGVRKSLPSPSVPLIPYTDKNEGQIHENLLRGVAHSKSIGLGDFHVYPPNINPEERLAYNAVAGKHGITTYTARPHQDPKYYAHGVHDAPTGQQVFEALGGVQQSKGRPVPLTGYDRETPEQIRERLVLGAGHFFPFSSKNKYVLNKAVHPERELAYKREAANLDVPLNVTKSSRYVKKSHYDYHPEENPLANTFASGGGAPPRPPTTNVSPASPSPRDPNNKGNRKVDELVKLTQQSVDQLKGIKGNTKSKPLTQEQFEARQARKTKLGLPANEFYHERIGPKSQQGVFSFAEPILQPGLTGNIPIPGPPIPPPKPPIDHKAIDAAANAEEIRRATERAHAETLISSHPHTIHDEIENMLSQGGGARKGGTRPNAAFHQRYLASQRNPLPYYDPVDQAKLDKEIRDIQSLGDTSSRAVNPKYAKRRKYITSGQKYIDKHFRDKPDQLSDEVQGRNLLYNYEYQTGLEAKARRGNLAAINKPSSGYDRTALFTNIRSLREQQLRDRNLSGTHPIISEEEIQRKVNRTVSQAEKHDSPEAILAHILDQRLTRESGGVRAPDHEEQLRRQLEIHGTAPTPIRKGLEDFFGTKLSKFGEQRRKDVAAGKTVVDLSEESLHKLYDPNAQKRTVQDLAQRAIESGATVKRGIISGDIKNVVTEGGQNAADLIKEALGQVEEGGGSKSKLFNKLNNSRFGQKLGAIGSQFSSHGLFAAAVLPSALQSQFGTVENPTGSQTGAKYSGAVGSGITGAAVGAQVGLLAGGPIGAAVGAAGGAIFAFVSSLREANNKIAEIDFDKSFSNFTTSLDNLTNGITKVDSSIKGTLSSGLKQVEEEANRRVTASGGGGNFFDKYLSSPGKTLRSIIPDLSDISIPKSIGKLATLTTHPIDSISYLVDKIPKPWNEQTTIFQDEAKQRADARRELLSQQLPKFHQIGQKIAEQVDIDPNDLIVKSGITQDVLNKRKEARLAQFGQRGGNEVIRAISGAQPEVPISQLREQFDQLILSSARLKLQQDSVVETESLATIEFQKFTRVAESVTSATSSLHGLQVQSDNLSSIFEGQLATVRTGNFAVSGQLGGVTKGAFNRTAEFAAANLGGEGAELGNTVKGLDTLLRELPNEISQLNPNVDPEEYAGNIGNLLSGRKGTAGNITRLLSATLGEEKPENIQAQAAINPQKFTQELIQKAFGDVIKEFESSTKGVLDQFDRFNEGLNDYNRKLVAAGEAVDRISLHQLDAQRASANLRAFRTGKEAGDFLSLDDLRAPFLRRQARLGGSAGLNPHELGRQIQQQQANLTALQGRQKEGDLSEQERNQLSSETANVTLKLNNLQMALAGLTDTTSETTAIQEKLNEVEKQRQGQLSFTEKLITASPDQLRSIHRGAALSDVAVSQGHLGGFNAEQINQVFEHLRSLENVKLPAYGGRTGGQVAGTFLNQANRVVFGGKAIGLEKEQGGLLKQQVDVQERAVAAQEVIAQTMKTTGEEFIKNLESQNTKFFQEIRQLLSSSDIASKEGVVRTARTNLVGATDQAKRVAELSAQYGGLDQARAFAASPEVKQLRDLRAEGRSITTAGIPDEIQKGLQGPSPTLFGRSITLPVNGKLDEHFKSIDNISSDIAERTNLSRDFVDKKIISPYKANATALRGNFDPKQLLIDAIENAVKEHASDLKKQEIEVSRTAQIRTLGGVSQKNAGVISTAADQLDELTSKLNGLERVLSEPMAVEAVKRLEKVLEEATTKLSTAIANAPPPIVAEKKAAGGIMFRPRGTDIVPAMLTPGEFVVNAAATRENLPLLHQINQSATPLYRAMGGDVDTDDGYYASQKAKFPLLSDPILNNRKIPDAIKAKMNTAQAVSNRRNFPNAKQPDEEARLFSIARTQNTAKIGRRNAAYYNYFEKALAFHENQNSNFTTEQIRLAAKNQSQLKQHIFSLKSGFGGGGSPESIDRAESLLQKFNQSKIGASLLQTNADLTSFGFAPIGRGNVVTRTRTKRQSLALARQNRLNQIKKARDNKFIASITNQQVAPLPFAVGGLVPSMVSPGEFIVNAASAQANHHLLNHMNANRSPIYRAGGGAIGLGGVGGGSTVNLSSDVKSTLDGFVRNFSNVVGSLAEPIDKMKGAADTFGNIGRSLDSFSSSASSLAERLGGFNDAAASLAKSLGNVNIPSEIQMNIRGDYNVVLNGGNMLATLTKSVAEEVKNQIMAQLGKQIQKSISDMPPR